MIALLFNLRTYAAARARLAAILVLVLVVPAFFQGQMRAVDAQAGSERLRSAYVQSYQRATAPNENFGRSRNGVRGEAATRRSVAHGRPLEAANASSPAPHAEGGDGERIAATGPRQAPRQREPATAEGDEDGDPEPSPLGFLTRAPPAPSPSARASALA